MNSPAFAVVSTGLLLIILVMWIFQSALHYSGNYYWSHFWSRAWVEGKGIGLGQER